MSRVLMIAMGVPSLLPASRHGGPGLRAAHLATALLRDGHEVSMLCVCRDGDTHDGADSGGIEITFVEESRLAGQAVRHRIEKFAPDCVVGVTAYAASLASKLRLGIPLWADIFGDLLSEAQAKAARSGGDWSLVHFWSLLTPVLESADRFSAVSAAQSHALVGQLGMTGRLSASTAGEELVAVIPCATDVAVETGAALRDSTRAELGIGRDDFVALCSGGFNTWCDVDTLADGLSLALQADPRLHVIATGGAIAGHDERSYERFRERLGTHHSRVHLLGWIDSRRLPGIYACADVGLNIERSLYERRLGAENRVVEWLGRGLPCITTAQSELGTELVARGLARPCPPGDCAALARELAAAARSREHLQTMGRDGRAYARAYLSFEETALPLAQWCRRPVFAGDHARERLVRLGLLSHPRGSTEMLEAYVKELSTPELLRRGLRWTVRRALRLLPVLVLATVAACTGPQGQQTGSTGKRPNILFLSIDTLRADRMSLYGNTNPTTPWMDRLGAGGAVFEQAVASAPETAPSVATLLTGLYQDRHGVPFNRRNLPEKATMISEVLAGQGYATAAFVGNRIVDDEHGFGQGFERFEVAAIDPPASVTTDDRVTSLALAWLRDVPRDKPWFAWVHLLDPHGPYNSASPWWSSSFQYPPSIFGQDPELPVSESNFGLNVIPRYQFQEGMTRLSQYVPRYDGEVRFSDHQVGALLGGMALAGFTDTLVVLTADHGESLTEHGELLQHGWFVYDATVRIPLIVSWPGRVPPGARIRTQICGVDIMPTILDLAGIDAGELELDGVSLADEIRGREPAPGAASRDCFSIGPRNNHPFALRSGGVKLILTPAGVPPDPLSPKQEEPYDTEQRLELYDLATDPAEKVDLIESRRADAADLEQRINVMRGRFRSRGLRW